MSTCSYCGYPRPCTCNAPEAVGESPQSIVTGTGWEPVPDEDLVRFRMFGCWNSGAVIERHEHGSVLVVDITGAVHPLNHRDVEQDPYPTTNPLHGKHVRRVARIL